MSRPSVELRDLLCFVAVYESRSFSIGARRLATVQSNVSSRIRALERRLRVELFERRYRGVVPTPAGAEFYALARGVLKRMDALERRMRKRRKGGHKRTRARDKTG